MRSKSRSFLVTYIVEYRKGNVKLSDSQVNKLNTAVQNRQDLTLRINIKIFNRNNLSHVSLLTTRYKISWEMHLKITCQLIEKCLKPKYLK